MDGVLLVDKSVGISSFGVVSKVKKSLKTRDVGHCGTLDPMAEGLMVVCVNKALKIAKYLTEDRKRYIAKVKLGETTATLDVEGEVIEKREVEKYDINYIEDTLKSFLGINKQVPPMYSAIQVNGKRLYEYARNNEKVDIPPREIEIYDIVLVEYKDDEIKFEVECSKGTYIRTLCADIASRLNTIGYMTYLRRVKAGVFDIKDSSTIEELENGTYKMTSIKDALLSVGFDCIVASEYEKKMIKDGRTIDRKLIKKTLYVDDLNEPLAMYEYDDDAKVSKCLRKF